MGTSLGLYTDAELGGRGMNRRAKKVLMFGGTGFAGRHLEQLLRDEGHSVISHGREVDIRNYGAVQKAIALSEPEWVVNFASITTVRESIADPIGTYDIAFRGTHHLLSALKETGFSGRILMVSSSEVYGHPSDMELPVSESSPLRPKSPYAVAKIAAEFLCYQWWCSNRTDIMIARPFTHIGPGQSDRFAISRFSRQIAEIMLGISAPLMQVGDLTTTRDFTDVRDTVRAYREILELGEAGAAYNICSGIETSLLTTLEYLICKSGITIQVETDDTVLRGTEQRRLCGSSHQLSQATGWRPVFSLERTLSDTLDFWLHELRRHSTL